ncbi:MAG: hypothetical protein A2W27_08425 [Deltaproteobacteria bacterium RBG_16_44_11]|nr:MAG: hypothetical protein A2W27_08425 [Deltaproteobacteria bacterium RBG_16_44_11]
MKKNCLFVVKIITVFVLITFGLGISDCASAAGIFYSVNMRYDAAKAVIPAYLKAEGKALNAVISVAEFIDTRQVDDKKEIGRVRERDDTRNPVYPKDVTQTKAVADGIKAYLKKAGYKVADPIVQWDLKEGTMPKGSGKIIIGGNIEELEVTCWRGVFSHAYKTSLKLTIIFADVATGKIIYKSKVESSSSKDDVSFSEEQLGGQLSTALGDAIEKVFKDKDVAQKLKEVLNR